MTQLTDIIQQEIEQQGTISFARFMELALYAPKLGYYNNIAQEIFGKSGDFVTAPLISPLFAKCLAKQCSSIITKLPNASILEIGAGTGIFASDLLRELDKLNCLPEKYYILEISETLRKRQQEFFHANQKEMLNKIIWLDNIADITNFSGVIIANEVIDALPIHCFKNTNQQMQERFVTYKQDKFIWLDDTPSTPLLTKKLAELQQKFNFSEDYISEINLNVIDWLISLEKILQQGILLLIDYGYNQKEYYRPERFNGTLICHHQHQRHSDPLILIGQQDITAHVDFTTVAESAKTLGFDILGFTTQQAFLLALGILELAEQHDSALLQYNQAHALKQLLMPYEMGDIVKVMALSKNFSLDLQGFSLKSIHY